VALDYRIRNRNRTRTKTTFPTRAEFCNLRLKALCSMDQNNVAVEIELMSATVDIFVSVSVLVVWPDVRA